MSNNTDKSNAPRDGRNRQLSALAEQKKVSLPMEIFHFLRHNKKWWLAPLIAALVLVGALLALGGTAVAPFIYTLF